VAGPNVLLIWDDDEAGLSGRPPQVEELNPHTRSLVQALEGAGLHVTLSERTQSQYTGFGPQPRAFDAVIHLNGNANVLKVMPASGATVLVDYVKNYNGAYLGSENNAVQMTIPLGQGLNAVMADVTLVTRTGGHPVGPITLTPAPGQEGHPVLDGLPGSFSYNSAYIACTVRSYATGPATVLMKDGENNDAVVVRDFGKGRAVYFHHAGNGSGAATLSDPNVQRLYINGVYWADRKPPATVSIVLVDPTPTRGGVLGFRVLFSEDVLGVDAEDFKLVSSGVQANPLVGVAPVSGKEYLVTVSEISGQGPLRLKLDDNDSILDTSLSANPLGGLGAGNGSLTSGTYEVDAVPPALESFAGDPSIAPVGERPVFTLAFSEAMDQGVFPTVTLLTASNGNIGASPLAEDPWLDDHTVQLRLDRAVTAEDQGGAGVQVSGGQDLVGNTMVPDISHRYVLVREDPPQADVAVEIEDKREAVVPGQEVSYRVTVTNLGPAWAYGVVVSGVIPLQLSGPVWACDAAEGASCLTGGIPPQAGVANIPPGGSVIYTLSATVVPAASGSVVFSAAAELPEEIEDPDPGNNQVEDMNIVDAVPVATIVAPAEGPETGSQFETEVTVDVGRIPLWGYQMKVIYDHRVLAVSGIEGGETPAFAEAPSTDPASFTSGTTVFTAYQATENPGPAGVVSLAKVSFIAVGAPGQGSDLELVVDSLLDSGGASLASEVESAAIVVTGDPPEGEGDPDGEGAPEGEPEGEPLLRVGEGLLALYTFNEGSGTVTHDVSGVGTPLDLNVGDPLAVQWSPGHLTFVSGTLLASAVPALKVVNGIRRSGELTIEAWVRTQKVEQSGPARILTISSGTTARNITLGQDADRYDVRLRSTSTSDNGLPPITSTPGKVETALQQVVFTRAASGAARLYINGVLNADSLVEGTLSNWDATHPLALANEFTLTRPWLGELHLAAIYGRALSATEITQNLVAGPEADTAPFEAEGAEEGSADGEGQPEGLSEGEGTAEGEGQPEGVPDGEGIAEGEGQHEGVPEGEGPPEGEGQHEGVPEGEGPPEGEGQPEGVSEGEGSAEGEGQSEGVPEGEGVAEGEGQSEGASDGEGPIEEGEGEGEAPPPGCNCSKTQYQEFDIENVLGDWVLGLAFMLALAKAKYRNP
jgi:uncharacterized repeat protein (TIGR01451 family)